MNTKVELMKSSLMMVMIKAGRDDDNFVWLLLHKMR